MLYFTTYGQEKRIGAACRFGYFAVDNLLGQRLVLEDGIHKYEEISEKNLFVQKIGACSMSIVDSYAHNATS